MGSDNELVRLEKYIEGLIAGYSALKTEKQNIEQQLVQVQAENEKMKQELDSLGSERGDMRERVNSLIDQIEQWESDIDEEAGVEDSESEDSEEDESEEEEPPAKKKGKGKRKVKAQKNLFNACSKATIKNTLRNHV